MTVAVLAIHHRSLGIGLIAAATPSTAGCGSPGHHRSLGIGLIAASSSARRPNGRGNHHRSLGIGHIAAGISRVSGSRLHPDDAVGHAGALWRSWCPARPGSLMAVLRRQAMTCGPLPVWGWWRSSSRVTSRTQCGEFSMLQCPWIQVATVAGAGRSCRSSRWRRRRRLSCVPGWFGFGGSG